MTLMCSVTFVFTRVMCNIACPWWVWPLDNTRPWYLTKLSLTSLVKKYCELEGFQSQQNRSSDRTAGFSRFIVHSDTIFSIAIFKQEVRGFRTPRSISVSIICVLNFQIMNALNFSRFYSTSFKFRFTLTSLTTKVCHVSFIFLLYSQISNAHEKLNRDEVSGFSR